MFETRNSEGLAALASSREVLWMESGVAPVVAPDPMPQLVMQGVGLTPHAFVTNGLQFYHSRALREALALPAEVVQYIEIDDSLSDPEVQAMDYRIALYRIVAPAADEKLSVRASWADFYGPDMEAHHPEGTPPFASIRLKEDFEAPGPVFYIAGSREGPYATADLARRVVGFPDLSFEQPQILDQK